MTPKQLYLRSHPSMDAAFLIAARMEWPSVIHPQSRYSSTSPDHEATYVWDKLRNPGQEEEEATLG